MIAAIVYLRHYNQDKSGNQFDFSSRWDWPVTPLAYVCSPARTLPELVSKARGASLAGMTNGTTGTWLKSVSYPATLGAGSPRVWLLCPAHTLGETDTLGVQCHQWLLPDRRRKQCLGGEGIMKHQPAQ